MQRVLSIWLPTWATDLRRRRQDHSTTLPPRLCNGRRDTPASTERATLLVTTARGRQIVACACQAAAAAGVRAGMDVSHARALLADGSVQVHPYEPDRDRKALDALAVWALRLAPVVAADPPDGLLLDIAGCQRLYSGEGRMLHIVTDAIARLGFNLRAAIAPTVGAAWAVARYGPDGAIVPADGRLQPCLADLPLHALRVGAQTVEALAEIAVTRIGDLYPLPRASLATRFGRELLLRLDQALGDALEFVQPIARAPCPLAWRDFAGPVTDLQAIELTVRELLDELAAQLARREVGATGLVITFDRIDTERTSRHLNLSSPSRDAGHLWALFRPMIERLHLGYGVERVTAAAPVVARLVHHQGSMSAAKDAIDSAQADAEVGRLIDQIAARFGADRVRGMDVRATHVPEAVFALRPLTRVSPKVSPKVKDAAALVDADRPSMLYPRPLPIEAVLLAPDGPVLWFRGGGVLRTVRTSIGPERITTPWWIAPRGASRRTRDYFKVQDAEGCWWWLFREPVGKRWFIHGQWS